MTDENRNHACVNTVGVGDLTAQIWRLSASEQHATAYGFAIKREHSIVDTVDLYEPEDIFKLASVLRLVAQELLFDGGLEPAIKGKLRDLVFHLERSRDPVDDEV